LKIYIFEVALVGIREELAASEATRASTEATNQLLMDEYQALQLALTSAEDKLRTVQKENETLVQQLMALKTMDVERMNFENEMFVAKQQQQMQLELAEAVKEGKSVSPELAARLGTGDQGQLCVGVSVPTRVHYKFEAHEGEVMGAKWDTTGRYFATSGADRKIKIWEMSQRSSPELRATLVGSNAAVMGIDFDSSGGMILGSSYDFATRVWTVEDSRLRHTLTGHSGKVLSAKFLGDATRVVSGSHDRTLKVGAGRCENAPSDLQVWDLRSKACIGTKFAGSSCNDLVTTDQVGGRAPSALVH
jgi:autophagy-related protein 16